MVQLFWHKIGLHYNVKNLLLITLLAFGLNTFAQAPKATFEKKGLKFENVKEGSVLEFYYYFTNTGSIDLKLNHVHPTCGCTVADYPTYAIKPGQRDSIHIKFDTKGRVGYNAKGVNLETNGGEVNLVFEAEVVATKD